MTERKLKPIRTSRTHSSDHEQQPNLEIWLMNALRQDSSNILKQYGLDRASLKSAGIIQIERVYNCLYVYSQGVYDSFQEITSTSQDRDQILTRLWNIYIQLISLKGQAQLTKVQDEEKKNLQKQVLELKSQNSQIQGAKDETIKDQQRQIQINERKMENIHKMLMSTRDEINYLNRMLLEKDDLLDHEIKKRLEFENKMNQLNFQLNDSTETIKMLENKINHQNETIILKDQFLLEEANKILQLREQISNETERSNKLQLKYDQYQIQVKSQNIYIDEVKYRNNKIIEQKQKEKDEIKHLQTTLTKQKQQIDQQVLDISNKENHIIKIEELYNTLIKQYAIQQSNIQELNKKLLNQQEINRSLNYELTNRQEKIEQNLRQINKLQEQIQIQQQQIEEFEKECRNKHQIIIQKQFNMENLEKQIYEQNIQHQGLVERLQQINFEMVNMSDELRLAVETKNQLIVEKKALNDNVRSLQKRNLQANQQISDTTQQSKLIVTDLKSKIEELDNQNNILIIQNTKLEQLLDQKNYSITELQNKYKNEELKKQAIENSIALSNMDLEKLRQDNDRLRKELDKLKDKLLSKSIKTSRRSTIREIVQEQAKQQDGGNQNQKDLHIQPENRVQQQKPFTFFVNKKNNSDSEEDDVEKENQILKTIINNLQNDLKSFSLLKEQRTANTQTNIVQKNNRMIQVKLRVKEDYPLSDRPQRMYVCPKKRKGMKVKIMKRILVKNMIFREFRKNQKKEPIYPTFYRFIIKVNQLVQTDEIVEQKNEKVLEIKLEKDVIFTQEQQQSPHNEHLTTNQITYREEEVIIEPNYIIDQRGDTILSRMQPQYESRSSSTPSSKVQKQQSPRRPIIPKYQPTFTKLYQNSLKYYQK
ncbi:hypothetical protein pb186bvf_006269 [Paramecium bursaria]